MNLLPLSFEELLKSGAREDVWRAVLEGGYPRIHDRNLAADRRVGDYLATYAQRDVRPVLNVTDLDAFIAFVRLAAGRTGQELNLSTLGADAGVSHDTARSWISALGTSFR